jgi:hypothetical protein
MAPKPVNVSAYVIRSGTWLMATVPYSIREAANLMIARR